MINKFIISVYSKKTMLLVHLAKIFNLYWTTIRLKISENALFYWIYLFLFFCCQKYSFHYNALSGKSLWGNVVKKQQEREKWQSTQTRN